MHITPAFLVERINRYQQVFTRHMCIIHTSMGFLRLTPMRRHKQESLDTRVSVNLTHVAGAMGSKQMDCATSLHSASALGRPRGLGACSSERPYPIKFRIHHNKVQRLHETKVGGRARMKQQKSQLSYKKTRS